MEWNRLEQLATRNAKFFLPKWLSNTTFPSKRDFRWDLEENNHYIWSNDTNFCKFLINLLLFEYRRYQKPWKRPPLLTIREFFFLSTTFKLTDRQTSSTKLSQECHRETETKMWEQKLVAARHLKRGKYAVRRSNCYSLGTTAWRTNSFKSLKMRMTKRIYCFEISVRPQLVTQKSKKCRDRSL